MGTVNYDTPLPSGPATPPTPAGPSPFDLAIAPFLQALPGINQQILGQQVNTGGFNNTLGALGQSWAGIANGSNNPIFAQAQQAQLAQAQQNAQMQLGQTAGFFNQQGMGGSGAALNALQRQTAQLATMQQGITSNLAQQQMAQQLGALGQQSQVAGQQLTGNLAAQQGNLGVLGAYLTNLTTPAQLQTAQTAAQNAGNTSNTGGSKGPMGTVICTLLRDRMDLPGYIYRADLAYGRAHIDLDTFRGYHLWAKPLVRAARKHPWVYRMIRPLGRGWAYHMAYRMGRFQHPNLMGAIAQAVLQPVCKILGWTVRHARDYKWRVRLAREI